MDSFRNFPFIVDTKVRVVYERSPQLVFQQEMLIRLTGHAAWDSHQPFSAHGVAIWSIDLVAN